MLENQVAQQAVALKQMGKLPSQPDVNSIEHVDRHHIEESGKSYPPLKGNLVPMARKI
ncbi:unnamed protein product [Rhodiola kirilowii]